ncbi:hypothetical protein SAMN05216241_10182 [Limimonas halophila]|uniref:Uncharacterized protein n=1 Tax=Limimonas halophila TaxID=1082479 RepID=A0A1G7L1J2_9PROT|nr:hypothetical protein [Limimonas halophila]SDF43348.1 hypothetical protein SAMN05216241_10182 [Limimonas halophila]
MKLRATMTIDMEVPGIIDAAKAAEHLDQLAKELSCKYHTVRLDMRQRRASAKGFSGLQSDHMYSAGKSIDRDGSDTPNPDNPKTTGDNGGEQQP